MAVGLVLLAAIMMFLVGVFQLISAIVTFGFIPRRTARRTAGPVAAAPAMGPVAGPAGVPRGG